MDPSWPSCLFHRPTLSQTEGQCRFRKPESAGGANGFFEWLAWRLLGELARCITAPLELYTSVAMSCRCAWAFGRAVLELLGRFGGANGLLDGCLGASWESRPDVNPQLFFRSSRVLLRPMQIHALQYFDLHNTQGNFNACIIGSIKLQCR